jgi:hypothetical protein
MCVHMQRRSGPYMYSCVDFEALAMGWFALGREAERRRGR